MSSPILDVALVVILFSGFSVAATSPKAQTAAELSPVTVPAKLDAEGLSQFLIPVAIANHTFWCNLDSGGSWVLSLDRDKATRAGLLPSSTGFSAGVGPNVSRDQRVQDVTIRIATLDFAHVTLVLVPRPSVVPDIDCVLGLGLLQDYAAEFDYMTPSLRLFSTGGYTPPPGAIGLPLEIDRARNPITPANIHLPDGTTVTGNFVLDTGAGYYASVVTRAFIDAHQLLTRVGPVRDRVSDMPGLTLAAARPAALSVGALEMSAPVTALLLTPSAGFIQDGLIGAGFLRRFAVAFDYGQRRAWFTPNARVADVQPFDASGVEFRPTSDGAFAVASVAAGSPGSDGDLIVGDRLLVMDGRRAVDLTLGDILDSLSRPAEVRELLVLRADGRHTVTLHLRKLL